MKPGLYVCCRSKANAKGCPAQDGKEFTVLAGSVVSDHIAPSFDISNKWYYQLREKLIADGIIKNRIFQQNYVFQSATAAASVVMGMTASGTTAWKPIEADNEIHNR